MKTFNSYPCVLTIAGTDPSGGAGIQADIKVISALGCYAASVITALVAQNTQGVLSTYDITPTFVKEQIDAVFNDLTILAVKIGMLHNEGIMRVVANTLNTYQPPYVVVDPVMVAKSGHPLLNHDAIDAMKKNIFPIASLVTPNIPEAERLADIKIHSQHDMECAAKTIALQHNIDVLLKGGHLGGEESVDVLFQKASNQLTWHHTARIHTKNTHGTGCSLSSAIAAYLAQGLFMPSAIEKAKKYLTDAIKSGSKINIGKGNGPVDHFYFMRTN